MKRIYITSLIFAFLFIIAAPSVSEAYSCGIYFSGRLSYICGDNYNSYNNYSDYNGYNIYYNRLISGPHFTSNYMNNAYPYNQYGSNYNSYGNYNNYNKYNKYGNYNNHRVCFPRYRY